MSFTTLAVTAKYLLENGSPATGRVGFTLTGAMQDTSSHRIVAPGPQIVATLDGTGSISVSLYANDDSATSPVGVTWLVSEQIDGAPARSYQVSLPSGSPGGTVDLATLAPATTTTAAFNYLLASVASATYLSPPGHQSDGTSTLIAKAAGNGKNGIVDWSNDDSVGYLFHLHTGANSTSNAAVIGIGTDLGHGGGILVAHKNDNYGIKIDCHPGSAIGEYVVGYSAGQPLWIDQFVGSGPVTHRARTGQGYNDGVTTQGSTTFTSSTASFTGADVGVALTQLTSTGSTDLLGSIPSGTTIASVTNSTTVVMSQAAAYSSTGVKFLVAGRAMTTTQQLERWLDTDGTTVLAQMQRGFAIWNIPGQFTTNDVAQPALKATGKASQTADIFDVFINGSGTPALSVASTGRIVNAYGLYQSNAGLQTQAAGFFQTYATSASVPAVAIKGVASQGGAQLDVQDSSGTTQSKFDKAGRFVTAVASAPALGDLVNGQTALSVDASGNLIVTSRVSGALKTATVTVA